jgi:hypothetical protein
VNQSSCTFTIMQTSVNFFREVAHIQLYNTDLTDAKLRTQNQFISYFIYMYMALKQNYNNSLHEYIHEIWGDISKIISYRCWDAPRESREPIPGPFHLVLVINSSIMLKGGCGHTVLFDCNICIYIYTNKRKVYILQWDESHILFVYSTFISKA